MAKDMKIGALVELSSAGMDTRYCRHVRDKVGIILEKKVNKSYWDKSTKYKIHWTPAHTRDDYIGYDCRMANQHGFPRRVLRYAKAEKKNG